jgi:hypothetical protein
MVVLRQHKKRIPSYNPLYMKECVICSDLFMTYYRNKKLCYNVECAQAMKKRKMCHVCHRAVLRKNFYKNKKGKITRGAVCKECLSVYSRRYQLRKNQMLEVFTREEWRQKVDATNGICPVCNRPYKMGFGLSLDHTPPISKAPPGFAYTIDDVLPMCRSCNSSKSDKIEWDGKTINLNSDN